ncbi:HNH endonuclease [Thalassospira povalilytica]|uniref:HNH endonuclease n=1 Tax=Thalassospira povalilytica TaxID=732237 RepID=A0ABX4R698_9PROT|nr:HNH endonuclease [Thalassospira povalilytica]PKR47971.1 HNH endonuclease [Thalassospira povalilytica]
MRWWECVELALINLNGLAPLKEIYAEVFSIRSKRQLSIPVSLEATVRKELEYNSSDSTNWRQSRDIFFSVHGIGNGVWGLRSMIEHNPRAYDIEEPEEDQNLSLRELTITRIVRDTALSKRLKALHRFQCQMCGTAIPMKDGRSYVEAHHIIPLGKPHNGPDIASNVLVVCPNHHAMLDLGAVGLKRDDLSEMCGHAISQESLDYHNTVIAGISPSSE